MKLSLSRYLTVRYSIALSLVFLVLLFTLLTFMSQVSSGKNDAYLVNISGMQRMLSQRIGLMASQIQVINSIDEAAPFIKKLKAATAKMRGNHKQLTSGHFDNGSHHSLSTKLDLMYFGSSKMNDRVDQYLLMAEKLLNTIESEGIQSAQARDLAQNIVLIARNGFLDELNKIVMQYELEAKQRINRFETIEKIAFAIGAMTLLLEILFIFRPMVNQLVRTTEELTHGNKELTEFSYRISHDVRAPIKSISGLVGVTEEAINSKEWDMASIAIKHMKSNVAQLEKLTDDIIEITKLRMINAPSESVNLNSLIEHSLSTLRFMDGYEKIDFSLQCFITKEITCQRLYVQQIVDNLISNGIKYADFSREQSKINIDATLTNNIVTIVISDNGLGIKEDYREKLFQMFQRFHPKIAFGSGLGLYLIAQNARLLQGDITYTGLDVGSVFTLTFPIEETK